MPRTQPPSSALVDGARRSLIAGLAAAPFLYGVAASAASVTTPRTLAVPGFEHRNETINGIDIHYTVCGRGDPVLLLHGWPLTWYEWAAIIPALAARHTVIAPDLRGIGGSAKPTTGYDLETKAEDSRQLLLRLGFPTAYVVGHDLGAEIAVMLSLKHPDMVRKLVVMEAALAGLPGAEAFMQHAPWWFSFHDVPGLAESVLIGNEGTYLDWFYQHHSFEQQGISRGAREEYVAAYTGRDALRGGFEHYRTFKQNGEQLQTAAAARLSMPVLALGGNTVGDILHNQLSFFASNLQGMTIARSGHFIPDEQPAALIDHLRNFFG